MNEKQIKSVLKEINKLLLRLEKKGQEPTKMEMDLLEDITEKLEMRRGKAKDELDQSLLDRLNNLVELSSQNKEISKATSQSIVEAINKIKLVVPTPKVRIAPPKVEVNVPEVKVPQIKVPEVIMPDTINVSRPSWIDGIINLLPVTVLLQSIRDSIPAFRLPTGSKEPVSVRLSDGEKFYRALGGSSGAASIPTYKNSGGEAKQGLVDDNGHVQVDVQTSALPTGASTEAKQDDQIAKIEDVTYTNTHTGSKEIRVYGENHICAQNTTSTPLTGGATFTGEWQDCLNYQEVNVSIDTDQNSATNGLVIQWSADGSTVADTDVFSVYANAGTNYTPNPAFRYVRVVYTNGSTPQTRFNLMTILRRWVTGGSFHRIDSTLKDDSDARLNITVPKLKTAANTYVSQQATTQGNAKMSLEEYPSSLISSPLPVRNFALDVARGLITGITQVNKFGAAPNGIQTTATDVWSRADSTPTQQIWLSPTAARIHAIVSSSTDDDGSPVGTGARTIRVYGLKTWDLAETSEDITLDGTTPVNTANSYVIIHRMKVLTCGANGPNVGTITATAATDTTITAIIAPGDGQTEMAIYGVPSIQSLYMTRWSCSIAKSSGVVVDATFQLRVNESPNIQTSCYLRKNDLSVQSNGNNNVEKHFDNPVKYAGPCIIKVQGIASSADVDAKSGFDGYLVTN